MNDENKVDPAAEPAAPEAAPESTPSEEAPAGEGEEPASTTPENAPADAPASDMKPPVLDPNASRTGFLDATTARPGDACTCPDGRPGTVHVFAGNPPLCFPNQG